MKLLHMVLLPAYEPDGRGLGVATVIHHTISGDTIQMPPVVWGEGGG